MHVLVAFGETGLGGGLKEDALKRIERIGIGLEEGFKFEMLNR